MKKQTDHIEQCGKSICGVVKECYGGFKGLSGEASKSSLGKELLKVIPAAAKVVGLTVYSAIPTSLREYKVGVGVGEEFEELPDSGTLPNTVTAAESV